ncbi:MGH1-like glycoside hydrolase domain-containing protein [Gluconacetobacter tumulisoli]|uniref:Glycoside hydrolase family 37 n=1 Tax=Gluconacetobacter tumulisoli TaxID=1286189 RepID=A0A7W4KA06_9PROT|nr:trehalase family glycosidase [Gluconacetobacter tumulisoli]MBB2203027.1 glycoside hydrolase family 37 [Gluconacetobacter tumulisoli]
MILDTTIPAERAWNSWSDRPAALSFLPLGVHVTPVLYATSTRTASLLPPGPQLLLGRHATDASLVEFETRHAGTRIAFRYDKADPYVMRGAWTGLALAEWGLRYWVTLCLSAEDGAIVRYEDGAEGGAAVVAIGYRHVALVSADRAVQVTTHDTIEDVARDFEANGYFYTGSRGTEGRVIALRFNLEMMREGTFAVAVSDDPALAIAKARAALGTVPEVSACLPAQTGRHAGALDAVRDIMAWNTLYDGLNRRPYTTVSRTWNLGRFAVWYNDQTYAALMCGLFDTEMARENMATALASATPQGNFACIVTSNDAWVDRTQAPNGAFMAWMMYLRSRDRTMLEATYGPHVRNHLWWRAHRDPQGRGLVSCGTSDVGQALYKGTHFGARNETGMDNSTTHDEALYDPATRTLSTLDVGLNCSLALDAEMLAHMARETGREESAARFEALADRSRTLIRTELWDEARGIFANRQRDGDFVQGLGPTSFYPLICGAATAEQAASLLRHLEDPATFGGEYVIPNATRDHPAFADNVYWRGRIWPNVNYFIWHALRRYGFVAEATRFAERSMRLFDQSWVDRRISGENYSAVNGEASDQLDADLFLSWGAMLPMLGVAEVMDINPWSGWEITLAGEDARLGPVCSPIGRVTLETTGGVTTLRHGDIPVLRTDATGRLTDLHFGDGIFSCRLHCTGEGTLALPAIVHGRVVSVRLDDRVLPPKAGPDGATHVTWRDAAPGARLSVHFLPAE